METAWKALGPGLTSHWDGSQWEIGVWRTLEYVEEGCVGFNCSPRVVDAILWAPMHVLARVEVDGQIIREDDKWTCQRMRVVDAWDWPKDESVRLAIYCAELVLPMWEQWMPDDPRPHDAVEMARGWLVNPWEWTPRRLRTAAAHASKAAAHLYRCPPDRVDLTTDCLSCVAEAASYTALTCSKSDPASASLSAGDVADCAASAWRLRHTHCIQRRDSVILMDQIEGYIQSRIPALKKWEAACV